MHRLYTRKYVISIWHRKINEMLMRGFVLQPRYLITSLALNDLAIGLLITPFGTIPALIHCWPYGEIFCQIQVKCIWWCELLEIEFSLWFHIRHCCVVHSHNSQPSFLSAWPSIDTRALCIRKNIINIQAKRWASNSFILLAIDFRRRVKLKGWNFKNISRMLASQIAEQHLLNKRINNKIARWKKSKNSASQFPHINHIILWAVFILASLARRWERKINEKHLVLQATHSQLFHWK